MGRKKIDIEPITNDRNKTVTFLKRKQGLFKKAFELSILCSVDIQVVILGSNRQFYEYTTVDPNEFNKVYYKDNMIHNIQTPFDYDENYSLRDTIDLNDTTRYKGPWNPNGKTSHKRTHSGRLVYTEDDASLQSGEKHHSKSGSNVDLEDIFEQEQINSRKRQKSLASDSDNVKKHLQLSKGVTTESILSLDKNSAKNKQHDDNEQEEDEEDDAFDSRLTNNHISAKKRRANNSNLLTRTNSGTDLVGKGNSYMFPTPLANSNLQPVNTSSVPQNKPNIVANNFSKLPTLDTHRIGRSSQQLSAERNTDNASSKNVNIESMGNSSAGGSMQINSQSDFTNKETEKEKNDNESDNENLITPTSANSLSGLTFEPNLFTPNVSRMNLQQPPQQIRHSPQVQQESFSRRPRLRVEIPKTNKEILTRQQEQMNQRNSNPSNIIPLSARGIGATTPGPLSANLFSNMQFQSATGMLSSMANQLNTPNLNMFINVGDKSAHTSNPNNPAQRVSYFEDAAQVHQNLQAKAKYRRPSESDFFSNTPTGKKPTRPSMQSPTFNSFLENGLIMSPDGTTNNKLNFKRGMYQQNYQQQPGDIGPLTAMGFGPMTALDMLNNQDYNQPNSPNSVPAGGIQSAQSMITPTNLGGRSNTTGAITRLSSSNQLARRGTSNVGPDKDGLNKVFPQLQRQKRQILKESSNDDVSSENNREEDDDVVPVSDKPADIEKMERGIAVNEEPKPDEGFLIHAEEDDVLKWDDK